VGAFRAELLDNGGFEADREYGCGGSCECFRAFAKHIARPGSFRRDRGQFLCPRRGSLWPPLRRFSQTTKLCGMASVAAGYIPTKGRVSLSKWFCKSRLVTRAKESSAYVRIRVDKTSL
jgi:hypothetical protein